MKERAGGPLYAASLNSPCRSTGKGMGLSLGGAWWGRTEGVKGTGVAGSYDGVGMGEGGAGGEVPRSRSCRLLSGLVWALVAVAIAVVGAAAFVDRRDSENGGSFEAWPTSPPFSPALPSLKQLVAGDALPTTPSSATSSATPSVARGSAKEEEGAAVVASGEGDNGAGFPLTMSVSSPPLPSSEYVARRREAAGEGGMKAEEEQVVEQVVEQAGEKQEEEEEEEKEKEGQEEEQEGSCASELSTTDSLDDVAGVTSIPSTDTAGLREGADSSDGAPAAAAATADADGGSRSGEGVQRADGVPRAGVSHISAATTAAAGTATTASATTTATTATTTAAITTTAAATGTTATGATAGGGTRERTARRFSASSSASSASSSAWGRLEAAATSSTKWSWPSKAEAGSRTTPAPPSRPARTDAGVTAPSEWGWVEAGAAVIGALALMVTVIFKSRSHEEEDGEGSMGDPWEEGAGAGEGMVSTPTGKGGSQGAGEDGELGSYSTVEMVKRGGTPATLRSVKRSRRISSSQVSYIYTYTF